MNRSVKRLLLRVPVASLLLLAACVTVNIYFPAAQAERTAEEIVDEVYKEGQTQGDEQSAIVRTLLALAGDVFGPGVAHAQDATSVSNAAIRGLKQTLADNHRQLAPFYASGAVGITNDGYLAVRDDSALSLQDKAQVKRLVASDNDTRKKLYQEVATALNVPGETAKVAAVFADEWRSKAAGGWWVQADDGSWKRK